LNGYLLLPDGQRVPIADGLTIGREDGCDVCLQDPKASRHHARIIVEGSVVEVEDLGSSNGTRLNGKAIRRRVLRAGDVIQIGTSLIAFAEEDRGPGEEDEEVAAVPAPPIEVIEFADEKVEVPVIRPMAPPGVEIAGPGRRLQYSRTSTGGGMLRDDLRQMGWTQRVVVVVLVLVLAAALGYVAMRVVGG
jgi:pSer/pThr/pTyr-binding forkhead associated (FHA) protein